MSLVDPPYEPRSAVFIEVPGTKELPMRLNKTPTISSFDMAKEIVHVLVRVLMPVRGVAHCRALAAACRVGIMT